MTRHQSLLGVSLLLLIAGCKRSDERIDLTRYVWIDPGAPIIDMHRGDAKMHVTVRNVHEHPLSALRLSVASVGCTAKVSPNRIERLIPGERKAFNVALTRKEGASLQRHRLLLTLQAKGLPAPAGLDLIVDLRQPTDQDWIDVGQVKLVRASPARKTSYYLLASVPLLLMLAWLIWRTTKARRKKRR